MKFEDELEVLIVSDGGYDENGNPIDTDGEWLPFPKCFLSFNAKAEKVRLHDGTEYMYSYYVICPLNKELYGFLPKEGDKVHIRKSDGTVDSIAEVRGFVTYKKRYLKIWV